MELIFVASIACSYYKIKQYEHIVHSPYTRVHVWYRVSRNRVNSNGVRINMGKGAHALHRETRGGI